MKAPLLELDGSRLVVKDTTGEDDIGKSSAVAWWMELTLVAADVMVVQANHPIPILDKDFYFEIEIIDKGARK